MNPIAFLVGPHSLARPLATLGLGLVFTTLTCPLPALASAVTKTTNAVAAPTTEVDHQGCSGSAKIQTTGTCTPDASLYYQPAEQCMTVGSFQVWSQCVEGQWKPTSRPCPESFGTKPAPEPPAEGGH